MKVYKLTSQDMMTLNETLWGPGVTHTASGMGELCSAGWLHAYSSPLLALFLNPIHANIKNPRMWEAEGSGNMKDDRGLKMGFSSLTTIREIPILEPTVTQQIAFGILCALKVYHDPAFVKWAESWLSGEDRSANAADAARATVAADAAYAPARAATNAAYAAAAYAAAAYAAAAYAPARAATNAVDAAVDAAYAAYAADYAVHAAAVDAAVDDIDLIAIAEEAMGY